MSQNTPEYDPELDDPDDDTTGFEDDDPTGFEDDEESP